LNKTYYDPADPLLGVSENIKQVDLRNARMVLCLGYGLGYDTLYYTEQISKCVLTEWMLVIEKDISLFHLSLKMFDLSSLLHQERVELILGTPKENLFSVIADWLNGGNRYYNARAYQVIYNKSAFELDEEYYNEALRAFGMADIYAVNNYGNDTEDSLIGLENMFANVNEIIENPGINLLKDKFKGLPGVVIATGPSLNKNKHLLKGIEDKAVLISCDATLKILLEMGVKPHIVTSLEREMAVVQLFEGIKKEQVEDVYLAACPVVYNEVYQTYPGKNIIIYRKFDHFKWLEMEKGMLDIKYSAGNMAFKIAEYLGCDPIILIGQDLALSREGKTNADGATLGNEQESYLKEGRFMVPGNDGQPIETTQSLRLFLQAYEIDMASHKGKCINATEGGAYIVGTEVATFAETIEKHISKVISPLEIIKANLGNYEPLNGIREKLTDKAQKTLDELAYMAECCKQGLDAIIKNKAELEKLEQEENAVRVDELLKECLKAKEDMQRDKEVWQLMFAHIGQSYFLNFELELKSLIYKTPAQMTAKMILMHEEYFRVMDGLMRVIIKALEKAKEKLCTDVT